MANFCPYKLIKLQTTARNMLKSMQKRPPFVVACCEQVTLW